MKVGNILKLFRKVDIGLLVKYIENIIKTKVDKDEFNTNSGLKLYLLYLLLYFEFLLFKPIKYIFNINTITDDSLLIYSIYYEYKVQHWFNYDKRRDLFIDIGANRGRYLIQALNLLNYKKAVAFEPLNKNLKIIEKI